MPFPHKILNLFALTAILLVVTHAPKPNLRPLSLPPATAQTVEERKQEADRLSGLAFEQYQRGQFRDALQLLEQALEIYRQLGDKAGEGRALGNLGLVYRNLGEYARAEQYYLQSLEIKRQLGDKAGEGNALNNLGVVYENLGEYARAEQYFLQSLEIFRQLGNKAGEGGTLNNLGNVYRNLGEYARAEQYFLQSLEIARQIGDKAGEGRALGNLGSVYQSLGEYSQAEQSYLQSLEIKRQLGDKAGEGDTLGNLGVVYQNLGEYAQAEQSYRASIEVGEQLRPGLTDTQKISLFEQQKTTYEYLQTVLIAQNKTDTALEISERGRARAFVELLAQRLADTPDTPLSVTPPNLTQIKQIAAAQNATIVQYSYVRDGFPDGNVKRLNESELYIWVIKPTGEISFRRTDLKPLWQQQNTYLGEVIANARCFDNGACRTNITVAQAPDGTTEVRSQGSVFNQQAAQQQASPTPQRENRELKQLHQLLIEPIADLLPTNPNDKVIFVPHASLFLVPFPALQDPNGTYLLEKHTILTAPSIQVLDFTHKQQPQGDILIVGNPAMPSVGQPPVRLRPLIGAEKEARDIGKLLNVTPLIGSQATESTVVQKMRSSRIIHLATHGSFDGDRGIESWIALTPDNLSTPLSKGGQGGSERGGIGDGLLSAGEIFDLNLNADLVVLSACDTGRGRVTGDGVVGLSRSLLSAGTASVLVSLWKVPDNATYLLMREFYQNWQGSGDKAQALRQAMLTTMQQYPNPENWAAFTLIGEAE